ncbi:hypothetical protein M8J71_19370 [Pseudarthrobacter sp. R1]|uniref:hypothetical protein n=1 Tax=Pseudarthrobacter sp. R1 TaxID=2944934 RepID=UPI002109D1D2|nr:hypothetical protein [Pseudarthrobacter sp. R1]MCQ6272629.1 hypothetical protein [Pseudarthrobacter sp. R1]
MPITLVYAEKVKFIAFTFPGSHIASGNKAPGRGHDGGPRWFTHALRYSSGTPGGDGRRAPAHQRLRALEPPLKESTQ